MTRYLIRIMNKNFLAIRAIASEYGRRLFLPIAIFVGIVAVLLIALMIWLVVLDLWWLLLAIPVMLLVAVSLAVMTILGIIIWLVSPVKTREQRRQVNAFVEKTQYLSEVTMTPKSVLLFRVVKDIVMPTKEGFVKTLASHSTTIMKDFTELANVFAK